MRALFQIVGQILVHLLVFGLFLRQRPAFRKESTIFAYHLISYILCLGGALIGAAANSGRLAIWLGLAISIHGIYSLSFLELWSLTEGSYSLTILASVEAGEATVGDSTSIDFERIGAEKKRLRVSALQRLGLIRGTPPNLGLTARGWAVARPLAAVIWLTKGRSLNQ